MSRVQDLLDLLEAFEPTPEEADAVAAVFDLLFGDGDVTSAAFFEPGHITASAFVVDRARGRLLLIHHGKLRTWLQPGGHIDPGEEVLAAAMRETSEFPNVVVQMVGVAERTGRMDEALSNVIRFFDREVEAAVQRTTTYVGPILLAVLAGVLVLMGTAFYLPLFRLVTTIQ